MNQVKLFSGDTQFVPKKMYCCNSIKYCGEILMNQGKFFRVTFSLFRKKIYCYGSIKNSLEYIRKNSGF